MLRSLGAEGVLIRNLDDWKAYIVEHHSDGGGALIIPGGESTAMLRIMRDEGLREPLATAIRQGMPVFGTCAGMILLARDVEGDSRERLATMDVTVRRNAYGRQLGSFHTEGQFLGITDQPDAIPTLPMTFIRAPYITRAGGSVEVLATVDGKIVAARQGRQLVCSFHPELDHDLRIHRYFLEMSGLA